MNQKKLILILFGVFLFSAPAWAAGESGYSPLDPIEIYIGNLREMTSALYRISGVAGPAGPAGPSGPVGTSSTTKRFGYAGSINISTDTVCGWGKACINTGPDPFSVTHIWASLTEGSTVAATHVNLYVSTPNATSPLMASSTYFPTIVITTRSAGSAQTNVSIATGTGAGFPAIRLPPFSNVFAVSSTMPVSGILPKGITFGLTGLTVP
jgi:hypothetical protein